MTPKQRASKAMSRYIRLRDAIEYCKERGIDLKQFSRPEDIIGKCCTCGVVKSWIRMDGGHFKGRGIGGGSGVYFDERNDHLQCKRCNGFRGGAPQEYEQFIIKKYGQKVLEELNQKHRIPIDMGNLAMNAMEQFYKEKYEELLEKVNKPSGGIETQSKSDKS